MYWSSDGVVPLGLPLGYSKVYVTLFETFHVVSDFWITLYWIYWIIMTLEHWKWDHFFFFFLLHPGSILIYILSLFGAIHFGKLQLPLFSFTFQREHESPAMVHRGQWSHSCMNMWLKTKCDLIVKNVQGEMQKRALLIIMGIICPLIFNVPDILQPFMGRFNHLDNPLSGSHLAILTTKCKCNSPIHIYCNNYMGERDCL